MTNAEHLKKLGIDSTDQNTVDNFVSLLALMTGWVRYEMQRGVLRFSTEERERMEKRLGDESNWIQDWLDEGAEEFLVG
mgnify:CR=1 FL=1